mmetsp:Transcript_13825/g.30216  ORF Transcript_13825/g.30216 Transcript_13825/m.30216 type:complete len:206 (-) Transcript_13825:70-687(-)
MPLWSAPPMPLRRTISSIPSLPSVVSHDLSSSERDSHLLAAYPSWVPCHRSARRGSASSRSWKWLTCPLLSSSDTALDAWGQVSQYMVGKGVTSCPSWTSTGASSSSSPPSLPSSSPAERSGLAWTRRGYEQIATGLPGAFPSVVSTPSAGSGSVAASPPSGGGTSPLLAETRRTFGGTYPSWTFRASSSAGVTDLSGGWTNAPS